jgi:hypothetical protein
VSSRALVALGALGLLAASCGTSTHAVTGRESAPVLMYTCCTASTVHRVYRPGEIVTLHWMRSTGGQGRDKAAETLKARLDGPFRRVTQAKASGALGTVQATGQPIQVAPKTAAPVSHIGIPDDAKPGLYKVTTTDVEGAGSEQTKTVIRVVAANH